MKNRHEKQAKLLCRRQNSDNFELKNPSTFPRDFVKHEYKCKVKLVSIKSNVTDLLAGSQLYTEV